MKKILVTGASGFCGEYLVRHLVAQKKYQVYGTYFPGASRPQGIPLAMNITRRDEVQAIIKKIKPDYICHLAAQSSARFSPDRLEQTHQVNIRGTIHLLEAMRRYVPQSRLLYTSSVHVYGRRLRSGKPAKENDPLWPESPYGFSKAISEFACLDFFRRYNLDAVIVRSVNFFGPGQNPELVFSDWCRQIAMIESSRQPAVIETGDLSLKRDFIFVGDAVEFYEKLLRTGVSGEIYNFSSGRPLALRDYLIYLLSLSPKKIRIKTVTARFRHDDPPAVRIDNRKVRALGWKPGFSVKTGLKLLLEDWRKRIADE